MAPGYDNCTPKPVVRASSASPSRRRSVLVLDPDRSFRAWVHAALESVDLDVVGATSAEPVAAIEQLQPDAVVISVNGSDRRGFALCNRIKRGVSRNVPVALVTSSISDGEVAYHRRLKSRADAYLNSRDVGRDGFADAVVRLISAAVRGADQQTALRPQFTDRLTEADPTATRVALDGARSAKGANGANGAARANGANGANGAARANGLVRATSAVRPPVPQQDSDTTAVGAAPTRVELVDPGVEASAVLGEGSEPHIRPQQRRRSSEPSVVDQLAGLEAEIASLQGELVARQQLVDAHDTAVGESAQVARTLRTQLDQLQAQLDEQRVLCVQLDEEKSEVVAALEQRCADVEQLLAERDQLTAERNEERVRRRSAFDEELARRVAQFEQRVARREAELAQWDAQREAELAAQVAQREAELAAQFAHQEAAQVAQREAELAEQFARREAELAVQVAQREAELADQFAQREAELAEQFAQREAELERREVGIEQELAHRESALRQQVEQHATAHAEELSRMEAEYDENRREYAAALERARQTSERRAAAQSEEQSVAIERLKQEHALTIEQLEQKYKALLDAADHRGAAALAAQYIMFARVGR